MLRKTLVLGALAMLVIPMGLCLAQDDPPPGPPPGPPPVGPQGLGAHPRQGPGAFEGPRAILHMFDQITRNLPDKLTMTAEQKTKFQTLVKQNRTELEELIKKLQQQKEKFDTDLNAMLTADQRNKLKEMKQNRERMAKQWQGRPGGPGMGGPGMGGPGMGGPGGPGMGGQKRGQRLMEAINQMNLSADKKEQIHKVMAESREKAQSAPQGERRQIMQDMMKKVRELLTPEERQQLREKMGFQGQGPGGQRRGGFRGGPGQPGNPPADNAEEPGNPPPPPAAENDSLW